MAADVYGIVGGWWLLRGGWVGGVYSSVALSVPSIYQRKDGWRRTGGLEMVSIDNGGIFLLLFLCYRPCPVVA